MPVEPESEEKGSIEVTSKQKLVAITEREVDELIDSVFRGNSITKQNNDEANATRTADVGDDDNDSPHQKWYSESLPQQDRDNLDVGLRAIFNGAVDLMLSRMKSDETTAPTSRKRGSVARTVDNTQQPNKRQLRSHRQDATIRQDSNKETKTTEKTKSSNDIANQSNSKKNNEGAAKNAKNHKATTNANNSSNTTSTLSKSTFAHRSGSGSKRRQDSTFGRLNSSDRRMDPSTEFHGNINTRRWPSPVPNTNYRRSSSDVPLLTSGGYGPVPFGPFAPGPPNYHHTVSRQQFSQHPPPPGTYRNINSSGALHTHYHHPSRSATIPQPSQPNHHHIPMPLEDDRSRYYERDRDRSGSHSKSLTNNRRGPGGEYDERHASSNRSGSESQSRAYSAGQPRSPSKSPPAYYRGGSHPYSDRYRDGYENHIGSNNGENNHSRNISVDNTWKSQQKRLSRSPDASDNEYTDERHQRSTRPIADNNRDRIGRQQSNRDDGSPRFTRSRTKEALESEQSVGRQVRNSILEVDRAQHDGHNKTYGSDSSSALHGERTKKHGNQRGDGRMRDRSDRSSSCDSSDGERRGHHHHHENHNKHGSVQSSSRRASSPSADDDDSRDSSYNDRHPARRSHRRHSGRHHRQRRRTSGDNQSSDEGKHSDSRRRKSRTKELARKRRKKDKVRSQSKEVQIVDIPNQGIS